MKIVYDKQNVDISNEKIKEIYDNILAVKSKLTTEEQKYYNQYFPFFKQSQIGNNCGSCQREALNKVKNIIETKYSEAITPIVVEEIIEDVVTEDVVEEKTKKKKKKVE